MENVAKEKKFVIEGGFPLKGEVLISGAKNAAIKMIAASLLTTEEVILSNIPVIGDVSVMIEAAKSLGVKAVFVDNHKLSLRADEVTAFAVDQELSCQTRATVMFIAPLLARFGQFYVGEPGGCTIGRSRPINRHLEAFEKMGAHISVSNHSYSGQVRGGLKGAEVVFEKNTVMGTENAILAAVLAGGSTQLFNAAQEPEVDDLILLLNKMGGRIERVDARTIEITGVPTLHGATHEILPDRNEAVTFALAAAATGGDVVVKGVRPADVTAFLAKLEKVGVMFESGKSSLRVWRSRKDVLQPVTIETAPYPGFMTDWQQPFCVLLTQAAGQSLVHDTIYINRFEFAKEINRMGGKIEVIHPADAGLKAVVSDDDYDLARDGEPLTVARISGPTVLTGRRLTITDLRAGATLVIAALAAKGKSEVFGVGHLDRGYETFDQKLAGLGAAITRLSG